MGSKNDEEEHSGDFSSASEGFSIDFTDREIAVPLTPQYSTFKKLEVVNSRKINFLAHVYHIASVVALIASTAVTILSRKTFSTTVEGIPGVLPDITFYTFPKYFTLVDATLAYILFFYATVLCVFYCCVIFRGGKSRVLNEQVWVILLLVSTFVYLFPYEPSIRLRRDYLEQEMGDEDSQTSYLNLFISLRIVSFSFIYILYFWFGTHSYRCLNERVTFRNWDFYVPKVIAILAYNTYKLCMIFIHKIAFSEMPFASFIGFLRLYGTIGIWPTQGVIAIVALTIMEIAIYVWIAVDFFKTYKVLRDAEYASHRTKILGFRFFLHQQVIFNVVYIAIYLLVLFGLPIGSQIIQFYISDGEDTGSGSYFDIQYAPFGLIICVLAFVSTEAYSNLPADFQFSTLFSRRSETGEEQKPLIEPVIYRNREPPSYRGIELEVRPNCFVMQTNIELFNLSWFVYYHGTAKEGKLNLDFNVIPLDLSNSLYNKDTDTRVILVEAPDRIIVAFKGTSSNQNLLTDMKVMHYSLASVIESGLAVENSGEEVSVERLAKLRQTRVYHRAKVHAGFAQAYETIKEKLRSMVASVIAKKKRPLLFTGHSLGGALATLASLDVSLALGIEGHRISVSTFGSPRVGNIAFQELYDSEIVMNWRIVAGGDLISRLPKIGYRHVGKKVILTSTGELFIDPSALEMVFWHQQSPSIVHHRKACYLLALKAWCSTLDNNYTPNFWPFPVSENDTRKFDSTFRKPNSQPLSPRPFTSTFSRRRRQNRTERLQIFADAIDALEDNRLEKEPSEQSVAFWGRIVQKAITAQALKRPEKDNP